MPGCGVQGLPNQGCGVGGQTGVGAGRSRTFWLELESELESVKFGRLKIWPELQTSTRQQNMILDE